MHHAPGGGSHPQRVVKKRGPSYGPDHFVTDLRYGIAPEPLASRRAARHAILRAMTRQWATWSRLTPRQGTPSRRLRSGTGRRLRPALRPTRVERPVADRDLPSPILVLALRQSRIGQSFAKGVRPLTKLRIPD